MKRIFCLILAVLMTAGLPLCAFATGETLPTSSLPDEVSYRFSYSGEMVEVFPFEIELAYGESASIEWQMYNGVSWNTIIEAHYEPGEFNGLAWRYNYYGIGTYRVRAHVYYFRNDVRIGDAYTNECTVNVLKMENVALLAPTIYDSARGENTGIADFASSFENVSFRSLEYRALDENGDPATEEWTRNNYSDHERIRDLAPGKYEARTAGDNLYEHGEAITFEVGESDPFYTIEKREGYDYEYTVKYGCSDATRDNKIQVAVWNNGNIAAKDVRYYVYASGVCNTESSYHTIRYSGGENVTLTVNPDAEPGTYHEKLIARIVGDPTDYEIDFTVNVVARPVTVTVKPDDFEKYEEFPDPELTFTAVSDFDGFVPEVTCTLRRDEGEGVGNGTIYADDVVLVNARDDEYFKTSLKIQTGSFRIRRVKPVVYENYIEDDSSGYYNDHPITFRFRDGAGDYDQMTLDRENWSDTLTVNEDGKCSKSYVIYLRNSSTGAVARCETRIYFDYVTQDGCEIVEQSRNMLLLDVSMRNLVKTQYSVDGGERMSISTSIGIQYPYINLENGIHTYTVYLTDAEGREISFVFEDIASYVQIRLEMYSKEGWLIEFEYYYVLYGDGFTVPEDYVVPYSREITGWYVKHGLEREVFIPTAELPWFQITKGTQIRPEFGYCIPPELITYEIPEVLHDFDLEIMRGLVDEIDAYRDDPSYYPNLTAQDRARLDAYYDELVAALEDPKLGHVWGEWAITKEATCYEAGERVRVCTVCGETESEAVDRLPNPFADVPAAAWFTNAVLYCKGTGKMSGTGEATFAPSEKVTRAMAVTVLWRLAGAPEAESREDDRFIDVPANAWYANAVSWAKGAGVAAGTGASTFSPDASVTREQLALIFMQYTAKVAGEDVDSSRSALDAYADIAEAHEWAKDALAWAVAYGILSGKGDAHLDPVGTATRAELAQIIFKYTTAENEK